MSVPSFLPLPCDPIRSDCPLFIQVPPKASREKCDIVVGGSKVGCLKMENGMSDYARQAAQRDAEQARLPRDMSNATAQEREKYNATYANVQKK